eukprot:TRINITY_DN18009_c0_g1_i1.p3 TRINITY_DN18009_c0_g1~~TRINITY_DN18009_c0_g1_i1.p3  ORF type:complete len:102 (+),score=7.61 TRINITY_DN18009_c0_g1_i1:394-699(+)
MCGQTIETYLCGVHINVVPNPCNTRVWDPATGTFQVCSPIPTNYTPLNELCDDEDCPYSAMGGFWRCCICIGLGAASPMSSVVCSQCAHPPCWSCQAALPS